LRTTKKKYPLIAKFSHRWDWKKEKFAGKTKKAGRFDPTPRKRRLVTGTLEANGGNVGKKE